MLGFPLGILSAAGAGGGAFSSDFELISSSILGSAQSSVTFDVSSYTSTYKHLQIRGVARDTNSYAGGLVLRTTFNSSTSGYAFHLLQRSGSTVISGSATSQSYIRGGYYEGNGVTANAFGTFVIDILDFASSTKNTTLRSLTGVDDNVALLSGLWANTATVTSVTLTTDITSFATGSRFSIYGIKG